MHLRVECPVRDVEAFDRVDEGRECQFPRRKPAALPPPPNIVAHATGVYSKRQDALRTDRRSDLLVVDESRRAAELAVLPDSRWIEHHHGAARLALDAATLRLPAAVFLGQVAKRLHQIELDDLALLAIDLIGRLGPAERAHKLLRCGIPLRLGTAGGALVFLECCDLSRQDM